jgi:hypothetical protein
MSGAADFRYRFRFDKQIEAEDPYGGVTLSWSTLETGSFIRKGALTMLKGTETVMGQRLTGIQPALIRVYRDGDTATIDSAWRAVQLLADDAERAYGLKSVADMEGDNRQITMLCEAGAADA